MHRQVPVSQRIYQALFPNPCPSDPPNFSAHLVRNLVPEVRLETANYYGALHSVESRYPGLNYTYKPHIRRLAAYPHHARLFRVIRYLGISDAEVLDLARWEGTLWARERYEKDEGIRVKDTTGDDIAKWVDPRRLAKPEVRIRSTTTTTLTTVEADPELPLPQTATSCELEVQEPEVDRPVVTASPAAIQEEDAVPGASRAPIEAEGSTEHSRPSVTSTATTESAEARRARAASELAQQILSNFIMLQQGRHTALPADLEEVMHEIVSEWSNIQQTGTPSRSRVNRYRARMLSRLTGVSADTPLQINIVSALRMFVIQNHIRYASAPEAARPTTRTSIAITQPA